ncbi:MAG: hypothetical protein ABIO91_08645 [Pyrinomonadaceae bacterium]
MVQFEYCPPFSVFDGSAPGVRPLLEIPSLQAALSNLRSRPNSNLSITLLVTEGDVSTLIPVTLRCADLEGMLIEDARQIIEAYAERRFRSMPVETEAVASV